MKNESETSNRKTVRDILDELRRKSSGGGYIYRGENKCHPSVSSGLYREFDIQDDNFDIELVEKEMLSDAKKHIGKLRQDSRSNFTNNLKNIENPIDMEDLERLTELQHYGGKTNLIDFTTDYLIALFFACDGEPEEHGRVILQRIEKIEDWIYLPQNPRLRVVAQKSIFVRPRCGFFCPDKEKEVVCVEKHLKQRVLSYLQDYHGISIHTIYNDLHGFITHQDRHGAAYTHFYRGLACEKKNEYESAIDNYNKVIKLDPVHVEAYYHRGIAHYHIDEIPEAIQSFSKVIELNPKHAEAYYHRGIARYHINEFPKAIHDYNQAIALNREYVEAYYHRGRAHYHIDEIPEAIQSFSKVIELNPKHAEAYYHRGIARYHINEFPKAIHDYNQAIALNREYVEAYHSRGRAYYHIDEIPEAIQSFSKVIELNPKHAEAYYHRGIARYHINEFPKAIQDYNQAIALNREYVEAYHSRGRAYYGINKFPEAIQDYNQAIALNREYVEAYYHRGKAYYHIDEILEAIQSFSKVIELNPKHIEVYYHRGRAYLSMEEWEKAELDLITAQNRGVDIVDRFHNDEETIEAFEAKHEVQVPRDITALLRAE